MADYTIIFIFIFLFLLLLAVLYCIGIFTQQNTTETNINLGQDFYLSDKQSPIYVISDLPSIKTLCSKYGYILITSEQKPYIKDYIVQINRDLSHDFINLNEIIKLTNNADIAISSDNLTNPSIIIYKHGQIDFNDILNSELYNYTNRSILPHTKSHIQIEEITDDTSTEITNNTSDEITNNTSEESINYSSEESITDTSVKNTDNDNFKKRYGECFRKIKSWDDILNISYNKELIKNRCPIRIGRVSILPYKYVYDETKLYINSTINKLRFFIMKPSFESRIKVENKNKIPNIIHQTFETLILPNSVHKCVQSWISLNPEYQYNYYTGEDCRDFIAKHFDEEVLQTYDTLIPGAYKADLWRCCVLYQLGGVYADIKTIPNVPLNKIINKDDDYLLVSDICSFGGIHPIYNAVMASVPKNPFIKLYIDTIVSNVRCRTTHTTLDRGGLAYKLIGSKGSGCLSITGPVVLENLFLKYFPELINHKIGTFQTAYGTLHLLELKSSKPHYICSSDNYPLIYARNPYNTFMDRQSDFNITSGKPHYVACYFKNMIYEK